MFSIRADIYLPMETMKDDGRIEGYGKDAFARKSILTSDIPKLNNDSVVGKSSIVVDRYQWIDLGFHTDTCLGNLTLCDDGFTFATFFKSNEPYPKHDQSLFTNGQYNTHSSGITLIIYIVRSTSLSINWSVFWNGKTITFNNWMTINNDNNWHHAAVTWDRPTTTFTLYFDGKLIHVSSNPRRYSTPNLT